MDVPRELQEQLGKGNVVAFVGAGLSIGAGLPGWYSLISELAERIDYELPPAKWATGDALIDAAQAYINEQGLHSLVSFLRDRLDTTGKSPTAVHGALARLPISLVLTANYDDLLERAYRDAGKRVHVVVRDTDIPFMRREPDAVNIVKLYGDLDQPDTIVLARQQYESFFVQRPQMIKLLETEVSRSDVLYLGWSYSDPHFNLVFGELLNRFGDFMRAGYAVMFDVPQPKRKELERKNIRVVELPNDDRTARLAGWLNRLAAEGIEVPQTPIKQVWFDESHNQKGWDWGPIPLIGEYGYRAAKDCAEAAGYDVQPLSKTPADRKDLADCDVLVMVTPHHVHLQPQEIDAIAKSVENGKSLLLMGYYAGDPHHQTNASELARKFGVEFNTDQVEDPRLHHRYPHEIIVEDIVGEHELLRGIQRLCFQLTCSLSVSEPAQVVLRSGPSSLVKKADVTDLGIIRSWTTPSAESQVPLVAVAEYGDGRFGAIGTWSVFLSEYMESQEFDNRQLYLNLLQWLTGESSDALADQLDAERTTMEGVADARDARRPTYTPQAGPGPIRNRWALLVGINRYVDPAFPTLKFCVNDVLALERELKRLGYTVVTLHDDATEERLLPTRDNIEAELVRLSRVAGPDDLLLAHFACHGKLVDGRPVLITHETRAPTLAQKALPVADVERQMHASKARRLVLILDACHTGVEIGRDLADPAFMRNAYELAEGFALIAASTAQQVAQEWQAKEHGVFTYYLLEALSGQADRDEKGFVTVDDVKTHALDGLRRWNVEHGGLLQEPTARTEGLGDIILADYRGGRSTPALGSEQPREQGGRSGPAPPGAEEPSFQRTIPAPTSSQQSPSSTELRRVLTDHFDLEELRTLCFDLGVDFDSLRGEGKTAKARELVAYLQRRRELDRLTAAIRRERGEIS